MKKKHKCKLPTEKRANEIINVLLEGLKIKCYDLTARGMYEIMPPMLLLKAAVGLIELELSDV